MISFKQFYVEDNSAGDVFSGGDVEIGGTGNQFPANNDLGYAPGDYRLPFIFGVFRRGGGMLKKRRRKNKVSRNAKSIKTKRKSVGARGRKASN